MCGGRDVLEGGLADFRILNWFAAFAPAGTPVPPLEAGFRRALSSGPAPLDLLPEGVADLAERRPRLGRGARPAPSAPLGTGHGRYEQSYVQNTRFERESATPNLTLAINYDRRENLVAMGILPPAPVATAPRAFPEWSAGFVLGTCLVLFLVIQARDPKFELDDTWDFLLTLEPREVVDVPW